MIEKRSILPRLRQAPATLRRQEPRDCGTQPLSDIAVLTTTIEYYRQLEAAVMLKIAKRRGLDTLLKAEFPAKSDLSLNDAVGSQALRTALGDFNALDLDQLSTITDLITQVRRERERVFLLFERKRRPALLKAATI